MAVKTITVTEEAYECVRRLKSEEESFSDLFKRLGRRELTIRDVKGIFNHTPEEAKAFAERVRKVHEGLGEGLERRAADVRARFKRFD